MTQNHPFNVCFLRNNILLTLKERNLYKLIPITYQHAVFPSIKQICYFKNAFLDTALHCQLPSPPPQKHHPFFLAKPSFKSGNCPIPLPPPLYIGFSRTHPPPPPDSPPLKFGFFSELQKYKNFSSLTLSPILSFKSK